MANANALKHSTIFESYIKVPRFIFTFLGVDMTIEQSRCSKYIQFAVAFNHIIMTFLQIVYNIISDDDPIERLPNIIFTNYNIVGLGKMFAIYYHRSTMARAMDELEQIYPYRSTELKYQLEHHFRHYYLFEKFIWGFYRFVASTFVSMPFLLSLLTLLQTGEFPLVLPLSVWSMGEATNNQWWPQYILYYLMGTICCLSAGMSITACDLCLYSMITQLCVHFDLLSKKIMELQPENEENSMRDLYGIARQHIKVKILAEKVNTIFGPSIIFSVMSSSFTLCLVAYQMLDDVPMFTIINSFILLMYESKQVIITCHFGQKIMEYSSLVNESLYSHNWFDGSVYYKRRVLFMLTYTSEPFVLNFMGLVDISLITLQLVYGNAYKLFTVFKST